MSVYVFESYRVEVSRVYVRHLSTYFGSVHVRFKMLTCVQFQVQILTPPPLTHTIDGIYKVFFFYPS